ncbi:MAG TPA: hypothetical protein VIJ68_01370 [Candidatus Saccharimonadales bacterium]
MIEALRKLGSDGFITPHEAAVAAQAQELGDPSFTLGYELEVMPWAIDRMPALKSLRGRETTYGTQPVFDCVAQLFRLGYTADLQDGLYETQSPASQHPLALAIATKGLVRAGVLPSRAAETDVSAHVNIGMSTDVRTGSIRHHRLIRMLRAVELTGGASPERLTRGTEETITTSSEVSQKWHSRGVAGVSFTANRNSQWPIDRARVELRSLSYRDPSQFGHTLEKIYFLGRGLLSGDDGQAIAKGFDAWFMNYMKENGLRDISSSYANLQSNFKQNEHMAAYITPFARHQESGDTTELAEEMTLTIDRLKEVYGMDEVISVDDLEAIAETEPIKEVQGRRNLVGLRPRSILQGAQG